MKPALILVDLQNDFMPRGALPVRGCDEIVPLANLLQPRFDLVVATRDWHPPDHGSFAASHPGKRPGERVVLAGLQQILWPVHCVAKTPGAAFVGGLDRQRIASVFDKGTDREIDSYSGFFDNAHRRATGLGAFLEARAVDTVYVMGLATDYCVKFTALDAVGLGLRVHLVEDGCRGVELQPGDVGRALEELRQSGVTILKSRDVIPGTDPPT